MEITIKLQKNNNEGSNYFYIYEVITIWKDGKKHITGRYINEDEARDTANMWQQMENIKTAFVIPEIVWIKNK